MSNINETLPNLDVLLDVAVEVSVELGSCRLTMREVLQLQPGSVVSLDRPAEAPVELSVNGKPFARGEVVVVDGKVGVKITELRKA
ncbi:MAG: flagellar motor switch protein FliN [Verrucomicrobiae bacterium]|nr:flagellar motor switch protein FliN [Verrucomicrobiae bacterium]MDW8343290.1 flagellar motor switch protein FliN [Verrucomicrobiae bacterium]